MSLYIVGLRILTKSKIIDLEILVVLCALQHLEKIVLMRYMKITK